MISIYIIKIKIYNVNSLIEDIITIMMIDIGQSHELNVIYSKREEVFIIIKEFRILLTII